MLDGKASASANRGPGGPAAAAIFTAEQLLLRLLLLRRMKLKSGKYATSQLGSRVAAVEAGDQSQLGQWGRMSALDAQAAHFGRIVFAAAIFASAESGR
eukprot:CAMPEP_0115358226 /NCGR_PEP_ID=MMETSP0270-20121206/100550_1 /TAXON_ID=71861 /ORGANISM="Scrippsiella trochoidea, Strain CCMP3099" /LENGTH=98 /DNA_ID=CAMNT_0002780699 /DNA_START=23 /DNA_END=320 /DNA_ORIENTATION=+